MNSATLQLTTDWGEEEEKAALLFTLHLVSRYFEERRQLERDVARWENEGGAVAP
jgi:hypothetical protein